MSYYDDLGLPPSATQAEIRDRYRELVMVAHPDHGGDPIVFRLLTEAYEVLGDPEARRAYDRRLAGGIGTTAPAAEESAAPAPPATDRWATAATSPGPGRGQTLAETFEGLASLSGPDVTRLGRRALAGLGAGAAVGAAIGAFTGQATALASALGLVAAVGVVVAVGHARFRDHH